VKTILVFIAILACARAQHEGHNMPQHEGHDMSQMQHGDTGPAELFLMNHATGTSENPQASPMPMLMKHIGGWQTMFMSSWFLVDTQQSGPRGHDKLYSPNWSMISAVHRLAGGALMTQAMISLDPATVTDRRYPLLFQTGETAYGRPLVDAQHPHDFIMALGISYARPIGESTMVEAYFAPVGDPALGPVAFPHRASAAELPQATLGHHWEDSSHIANEVLTVGITHKKIRLEASGFYGREPDEARWNIDYGPMDSWSTRFSVMPTKNWVAQFSIGNLRRPEIAEPDNILRTTASVHYTRGGWSSSLIWGRNRKSIARTSTDAYTAETVARFRRLNFITARVESVQKDELFDTHGPAYRIGAYTVGYTRDLGTFDHIETGIGANFTAYTLPESIKPFYGNHPVGVNIYLRLRLQP
jgi:hypothetical protein